MLSYFCAFAQTPTNDDCANLIDLGEVPNCNTNVTYTNFNATASNVFTDPNMNIPSCFNTTPDADVWFSFSIPANGSITDIQIDVDAVAGTNGGITQPQMAIYRGDCSLDGLQEVGCFMSAAGETSLEAVMIGLLPGFTYYIRLEDWSATAAPNWGDFTLCIKEPDPIFNIADDDNTSLCAGSLFDSGGATGDYSNNENNTFTVCPNQPFACININVVDFDIENNFDFLTIYAGATTSDPIFLSFSGTSATSNFGIDSDCVTFGFISDESVTNPGFELTWECSSTPCDNPFITCANPDVIPALPYVANDLTTCGTLDAQTFGPCDNFFGLLAGEDYIFTYESPGDECIRVEVTGANVNTGVSIYDDCPESSFNCFGTSVNLTGDTSVIQSSYLEMPGTYYIVVDNFDACTEFNITIDTTTCPEVLPAAALCEDAISINGCGNLPNVINVSQEMTPDPDCFIPGVNDGLWGGIGDGRFTWFYFQAQANGNFGFVASNGEAGAFADIDLNVWGPIADEMMLCDFMKNNQPARSTWAAPNLTSTTGLVDISPTDGSTIDDEMEGAGGDGFVTTLPVTNGSWYLVLVNDFSGTITDQGILMDFSPTSPGVLGPNPDNLSISQDMAACAGVPFELLAEGGSTYEWFPATGLSCTECPNPTATVNGPTTYQVAITTACSIDTLSVDIAFMEIDAGPDVTLCQGELLTLGAQSNLNDVIWEWTGNTSALSCTDCPNPILNTTGLAPGNITFTTTASTPDCSDSDEIMITILDASAPSYEIAASTSICEGQNIDLGGPAAAGVNYSWSSNLGGFSSDESNPNVSPTQTTTYYLEVDNMICPNSIIDSVQVQVVSAPVIPMLSDTTICNGEQVSILSIVTSNDVTYNWSPTTGVGDPNLANNIFTPTETTTYTLTAANGACTTEESFTIVIASSPTVTVESTTICEGMEAILTADANVSGSFTWQPGGTTGNTLNTGLLSNTTTYTVSFVDDNGCAATDATATVEVVDGVEITDLTLNTSDPIYQGSMVNLTTTTDPIDNISYVWSNGSTTNPNTVTTILFPTETYTVTVTDQFGCSATETISINVLPSSYDIPNVFTPDNDENNDTFGPFINGENIQIVSLKIFNRWGQKVHDESSAWDGTINDQPAPTDVYVYHMVLQLPTGEVVSETGDLTLIR